MKKLTALIFLAFLSLPGSVAAQGYDEAYQIQPGDVLEVSVWNQEHMRRKVLVLPDGNISYLLAGHFSVAGHTSVKVEDALKKRLVEGGFFVTAPPLTVSVTEARGYQIFVMGRVNRPGAITLPRRVDVMQALSLAGGLDSFADAKRITVIRRPNNGPQQAISLNYPAVRSGQNMSSNIMLAPGDVVVVPEVTLF